MQPLAPAHTPPAHVAIEMERMDAPRAPHAMGNDHEPNAGQRPGGAARWLEQQARNVGLAATRNLASVAVPTFARELSRRTVFQQLASASQGAAVGGALVAGGALPIGLQMAGIYRDAANNTQTRASLASRLAGIVVAGAPLVGLAAVGGAPLLATAAPALMAANFVYTPMRDAIQYNLRLSDNTHSSAERPATGLATALGAAAYAVNQTVVGIGMDAAGDAAAGALRGALPGAQVAGSWARGVADGVGQGLSRAAVNVLGETADEMTLRGAQPMTAGTEGEEPLQLRLGIRPPEQRTSDARLNTALTTHAGRESLFAGAYHTAYAADHLGANGPTANLAAAGVLGIGYPAFLHMHSSRAPAQDVESQAGLPLLSATPQQADVTVHVEREVDPGREVARAHQPPLAPATNPDIAAPSVHGLTDQIRAEAEQALARLNAGAQQARPRA